MNIKLKAKVFAELPYDTFKAELYKQIGGVAELLLIRTNFEVTQTCFKLVKGKYINPYTQSELCDALVEQYWLDDNFECVLGNWDTFHEMNNSFNETMITSIKVISEERFTDMLEVLPPCKWNTQNRIERFHVSERITGDLVSWFFRVGTQYYECVDYSSLTWEKTSEILKQRITKMSPSILKQLYLKANPEGYFFDTKTLKSFGDSMSNYRVSINTVTVKTRTGNVECYELERKRAVTPRCDLNRPAHMQNKFIESAFFNANTFELEVGQA